MGTTIALLAIVVGMADGIMYSPTEIFDANYRRYIGEFFLLVTLMYGGIFIGYLFFIIPSMVISLA